MKTLPLAELAKMTPRQQYEALVEFASRRHEPPHAQLAAVETRIAQFEREFGMVSAVMQARVQRGELNGGDCWIERWSFLLDARDRLREAVRKHAA